MPKFITRKWIEIHDQYGNAENRYRPSKQIRFKTPMLSDLCDYSNAYIVVKGTISVIRPNNAGYGKKLAFRNNTPLLAGFQKLIIHSMITYRI